MSESQVLVKSLNGSDYHAQSGVFENRPISARRRKEFPVQPFTEEDVATHTTDWYRHDFRPDLGWWFWDAIESYQKDRIEQSSLCGRAILRPVTPRNTKVMSPPLSGYGGICRACYEVLTRSPQLVTQLGSVTPVVSSDYRDPEGNTVILAQLNSLFADRAAQRNDSSVVLEPYEWRFVRDCVLAAGKE